MTTFEHVADAWTVGRLRAVLDGLPDDLPIVVDVAEEPGGHVGFGHGVAGDGTEFIGRELRIGCEFPTGTYHRRQA